MDLKALDAFTLERVDKGQLCEVYNHYLHYSVLSLQKDKTNSYACTSVPSDLEWIWNWSFIDNNHIRQKIIGNSDQASNDSFWCAGNFQRIFHTSI